MGVFSRYVGGTHVCVPDGSAGERLMRWSREGEAQLDDGLNDITNHLLHRRLDAKTLLIWGLRILRNALPI
jgi:hypothetical protein